MIKSVLFYILLITLLSLVGILKVFPLLGNVAHCDSSVHEYKEDDYSHHVNTLHVALGSTNQCFRNQYRVRPVFSRNNP